MSRGLSFFFFQAEDGIRDHCVTGVQTCALPISLPASATVAQRLEEAGAVLLAKLSLGALAYGDRWFTDRWTKNRSEERRVGKECRSGWWAYHEKKKEKSMGEEG